jgi:SAM-dependent methyltransferase
VVLDPLRYCRSGRREAVCQGDVSRLPFRAETFDLISALDTIEHVADDAAALGELFRVCRPGGTVLLTVPAFAFLWGNLDTYGHHYRRYTRPELLARVRGAGFTIRVARFFNYLLFPPIALIRLLARLRPSSAARPGDAVRTDFDVVKQGPLNTLLARLFALEASLPLGPPFGVSLLCVAAREPGAEHSVRSARASAAAT